LWGWGPLCLEIHPVPRAQHISYWTPFQDPKFLGDKPVTLYWDLVSFTFEVQSCVWV
jgi:hypothetical protein